MHQVRYPENIPLKNQLKRGDQLLIARASGKSIHLIRKIFSGTRKMNPEVLSAYKLVIKFKNELEHMITDMRPG